MMHNLKVDFSLIVHLKVGLLIRKSEMEYVALVQNTVVNLRQKNIS